MFPLGFQTDILYNFAKTLLFIPKHAPVDFVFNFSKHFPSSSSQKFRYYLWFIVFPQSYIQSNSNPSILFSKYILNPFTSQHFNYYLHAHRVWSCGLFSGQGHLAKGWVCLKIEPMLCYFSTGFCVSCRRNFFFLGTRFLARLSLKGSLFPNCTKTGYLTPSITLVKLTSFLSQTTVIAL